MKTASLRVVEARDLDRVLEINNAAVPNMNELDIHAMRHFAETSPWFRVAVMEGTIEAFLIALRPGAGYESINYRWFEARYPDFVYVDRIAVHEASRGRGLGALLYDDVISYARSAGSPIVCAEVNLHPPNPGSIAFHERHGFERVGELDHADEGKRVAMFVRRRG